MQMFRENTILTALVLSFMAIGGPALAAALNCGDLVLTDTTLESDLICDSEPFSNGIVVGADDVIIDLNGYTISGADEYLGIVSDGFSGLTVKNGAISGFETGIHFHHGEKVKITRLTFAGQISDSIVIGVSRDAKINDARFSVAGSDRSAIILANVHDAKVSNVFIDGGGFGILSIAYFGVSRDFKVEDSVFANIDGVGVRIVRNIGARVENNNIAGKPGCYSGIDVVEAGPSKQVHILDNVITGCDFGIFVASEPPSSELEIRNNHLFSNGDGIFVVGLEDSRLIGNRAHLNTWVGIGLLGGSSGNRILTNTATGNGVWDLGHDLESTPNRWEGNTCVTSVGAEVDCP